jgi:putative ABC transport system ATP-binding protein
MGLEPPTKGIVKYRGKNIYDLNDNDLSNYRREHLGIVFQQSNFIKALKVAENVAYPLMISGCPRKEAYKKAVDKLKQFDLHQFAKYTPTELSGGEQQRITIARALIGDPDLVIADEPTGNLDTKNGEKVMDIFKAANNEKCAILMVTHNPSYDIYGTKLVYMADDVIVKIVDKANEVVK